MKCEICEKRLKDLDEEGKLDFESIMKTGRCEDCFEEYGEIGWPDRFV